jgi:hypothetical protein
MVRRCVAYICFRAWKRCRQTRHYLFGERHERKQLCVFPRCNSSGLALIAKFLSVQNVRN